MGVRSVRKGNTGRRKASADARVMMIINAINAEPYKEHKVSRLYFLTNVKSRITST